MLKLSGYCPNGHSETHFYRSKYLKGVVPSVKQSEHSVGVSRLVQALHGITQFIPGTIPLVDVS